MIGEINPIKPSEVVEKKLAAIPNEMIQAVNEMIVKHWDGHEATFKQDELIERYFVIIDKPNSQSNREILFENRFLNFEPIFEKEGWNVKYDKPGFNENYPSTFTFKVKK
jgi:hypothetical protein